MQKSLRRLFLRGRLLLRRLLSHGRSGFSFQFGHQSLVACLHALELLLGIRNIPILIRMHGSCQLPVGCLHVLDASIRWQSKENMVDLLTHLLEFLLLLVVLTRPFHHLHAGFMHKAPQLAERHLLDHIKNVDLRFDGNRRNLVIGPKQPRAIIVEDHCEVFLALLIPVSLHHRATFIIVLYNLSIRGARLPFPRRLRLICITFP
mmetsp:Transcript_54182/g.129045  ORF Transcript_54182/g.129045 Transcript_54182/m.129045 type:complete len:205 (+) Transcript_54182:1218-1832(+)